MQRRKEEKQRRAEKRDRYKHFYCHGVDYWLQCNVHKSVAFVCFTVVANV